MAADAAAARMRAAAAALELEEKERALAAAGCRIAELEEQLRAELGGSGPDTRTTANTSAAGVQALKSQISDLQLTLEQKSRQITLLERDVAAANAEVRDMRDAGSAHSRAVADLDAEQTALEARMGDLQEELSTARGDLMAADRAAAEARAAVRRLELRNAALEEEVRDLTLAAHTSSAAPGLEPPEGLWGARMEEMSTIRSPAKQADHETTAHAAAAAAAATATRVEADGYDTSEALRLQRALTEAAQGEVAALTRDLDDAADRIRKLRDDRAEALDALARAEREKTRAEADARVLADELQAAGENADGAAAAARRAEQNAAELDTTVLELEGRLSGMSEANHSARDAILAKDVVIATLTSRLEAQTQRAGETTSLVADLQAKIEALAAPAARVERLEAINDDLAEEVAQLRRGIDAEHGDRARMEGTVMRQGEEIARLRRDLDAAGAFEAELAAERDRTRAALADLRGLRQQLLHETHSSASTGEAPLAPPPGTLEQVIADVATHAMVLARAAARVEPVEREAAAVLSDLRREVDSHAALRATVQAVVRQVHDLNIHSISGSTSASLRDRDATALKDGVDAVCRAAERTLQLEQDAVQRDRAHYGALRAEQDRYAEVCAEIRSVRDHLVQEVRDAAPDGRGHASDLLPAASAPPAGEAAHRQDAVVIVGDIRQHLAALCAAARRVPLLEQDVHRLRDDYHARSSQVASCEGLISDLQHQLAQVSHTASRVGALEDALQAKAEAVASLEARVADQGEGLARARVAETGHDTVRRKLRESEAVVLDLQRQTAALTEQIDGLESQLHAQASHATSRERVVFDLQQQNAELTAAAERCGALEEEVAGRERTIAGLEREVAALENEGRRADVMERELKTQGVRIMSLEDAVHEERARARDAAAELLDGQRRIADLTHAAAQAAAGDDEIASLRQQRAKDDTIIRELRSQVEYLSASADVVASLDERIQTMEHDLRASRAREAELLATVKDLSQSASVAASLDHQVQLLERELRDCRLREAAPPPAHHPDVLRLERQNEDLQCTLNDVRAQLYAVQHGVHAHAHTPSRRSVGYGNMMGVGHSSVHTSVRTSSQRRGQEGFGLSPEAGGGGALPSAREVPRGALGSVHGGVRDVGKHVTYEGLYSGTREV